MKSFFVECGASAGAIGVSVGATTTCTYDRTFLALVAFRLVAPNDQIFDSNVARLPRSTSTWSPPDVLS